MRNVRILPYNAASVSALAIANELDTTRIRLRNRSNIHTLLPKTIINWGNSGHGLPSEGLGEQHTVLNPCDKVKVAGNKLLALQTLSEASVRVPEFTTDSQTACDWIVEDGLVVERQTLTGHSAQGLYIRESQDDLESAPLYTRYVKKQDEYRVHIMKGVVIDVQRKALSSDYPATPNWRVRNHSNGFVYVREGVNPHVDVINQAQEAIVALGLDFGAVDVIWNAHYAQATVLEVNTACGLEGTTLERYVAAFKAVLGGEIPATAPVEAVEVTEPPSGESANNVLDEILAGEDVQVEDGSYTGSPIQPLTVNVGDYVRIIRGGYGVTEAHVGEVLRVTSVSPTGMNLEGGWGYLHGHLNNLIELVDTPQGVVDGLPECRYSRSNIHHPDPTFQRGDTVRVVGVGQTYPNISWMRTATSGPRYGEGLKVLGTSQTATGREVVAAWNGEVVYVIGPQGLVAENVPTREEFPSSVQEVGDNTPQYFERGTVLRARENFYSIAAGSLVVVGCGETRETDAVYPIPSHSRRSSRYSVARVQFVSSTSLPHFEEIGKYSELSLDSVVQSTTDDNQAPTLEDENTEYAIAIEGKTNEVRYSTKAEAAAELNSSFFYNLRRLYPSVNISVVQI